MQGVSHFRLTQIVLPPHLFVVALLLALSFDQFFLYMCLGSVLLYSLIYIFTLVRFTFCSFFLFTQTIQCGSTIDQAFTCAGTICVTQPTPYCIIRCEHGIFIDRHRLDPAHILSMRAGALHESMRKCLWCMITIIIVLAYFSLSASSRCPFFHGAYSWAPTYSLYCWTNFFPYEY